MNRSTVGAALIVLGGVFLFLGALLSDASRLLDPDDFADRVAASLQDERVAAVVAEQLTDAALTQQRDLIAYRPLILAAARDVVRSEAFRGVARTAARQAHTYLFSETARSVIVSVPDLEVVLRSALSTSPGIAQAIPEDIAVQIAELPSHPALRFAVGFFRFGLALSQYAWLALIAGTLLMALGVWRMRDRRDALVAAGATLIVAGIGLWATGPVGSTIIAGLIHDDATEGALAGLWSVALGGVPEWGLTYAGIGVVLAAAGGSLLERLDLPELIRDARELLMAPYRRPAARLARGVALVVFGMFVVFAPRTTIAVLGIVAGVVVLFIGLREVFGVVLHAAPAEQRIRAAFATTGEGWAVGGVLVVLLAATFLTAILLLHRGRGARDGGAAQALVDECNGSAALCDLRLDQVTLAGTHNAMSAADEGWLFPNQETGIANQLEDGIRAVMIDVHYGRPVGDRVRTEIRPGDENVASEALGPEGVEAAMRIRNRLVAGQAGARGLYLCHGFCELGFTAFDSALAVVRDFLVRNPGEVLLLIVEDHVEAEDLASAFSSAGLERFVYRGSGSSWPTLGEMVSSGHRLVVLIESGSREVPWLLPAFDVMQETPYRFLSAADTLSCAPNRGGTAGSLFLMNNWIETAPAPRPSNAAIVNSRERLDERVRRCEAGRGRRVNVVAVDFYRTGSLADGQLH